VVGSSPPPHMSLSYVDVREFFNFFVDARALSVSVAGCLWIALGLFVSELLFGGRQGWGLGIPLPFLGCRIRRGSPRDCPGLRGSTGPGAWHPLAPSWVPRPGVCVSRLLLVVPRLASHVSWGFFVFPVSYGAYATRHVSIVGTVSSPLACSRCLFRGVWARFRISRLFSGWFVSSVACVVISLVCELTVLLFRSSAA